ncbi:MAG: hypothetical protein MHMPM18_004358, partial [Marteilia pararefringens]
DEISTEYALNVFALLFSALSLQLPQISFRFAIFRHGTSNLSLAVKMPLKQDRKSCFELYAFLKRYADILMAIDDVEGVKDTIYSACLDYGNIAEPMDEDEACNRITGRRRKGLIIDLDQALQTYHKQLDYFFELMSFDKALIIWSNFKNSVDYHLATIDAENPDLLVADQTKIYQIKTRNEDKPRNALSVLRFVRSGTDASNGDG